MPAYASFGSVVSFSTAPPWRRAELELRVDDVAAQAGADGDRHAGLVSDSRP